MMKIHTSSPTNHPKLPGVSAIAHLELPGATMIFRTMQEYLALTLIAHQTDEKPLVSMFFPF